MGAKQLNQRAATRVARNIVSYIKQQALRPGSKLQPEHVMVEEQGVARGTIREAIRYLEFQGALRVKAGPGGGPRVSVPGLDHLTSALSLQLQFTNASFRSVLDARASIYPTLAAEASKNASYQDISSMRECLSRLSNVIEDSDAATSEARRFYELVASASQNLVLGFLMNALHRISENPAVTVTYTTDHWRVSIKQFEKMLRAIEKGNAESARAISKSTHDAGIRYWETNFPQLLEQPVSWVVHQ